MKSLLLLPLLTLAAPAIAQDWPDYGNDPGGSRHSPLDQIHAANVDDLTVAWTYRSGDFSNGENDTTATTFEATPVLDDGRLFFCTPYNRVIALDAAKGTEIWTWEPDPPLDRDYNLQHSLICRGVAVWRSTDEGVCSTRVFEGILDGRLAALDADTGQPCTDFGDGGIVDLNSFDNHGRIPVNMTSAPVIWNDLVIVGTAIGDNIENDLPDGIVRAFDVRTGREVWSWDPIPVDQRNTTGAANAWAPLSVDPERDLVFVPTGSPSPDYFGGLRQGAIPDANAVVALDAATGAKRWSFQTIHHDLFDFDVPAQPTLVDVRRDGRTIPAVVQATKTGYLFVLDRETGDPLFPVVERPVPRSWVPGETAAPTQPMPLLPPPLFDQGMAPRDAWGITPIDRAWCADAIADMRADGLFTPPSLEGSVQRPFYGGGSNWGGVAFDPASRLVIVNGMNLTQWVRLIPRERDREPGEGELGLQKGTPYAMRRGLLMSPLGVPCNAPPWGTLAAIDIDTGQIRWQVPLGRTPAGFLGIETPASWGAPNLGGPIVTAGGLVFIAATADARIRAFNVWTGAEVWTHDLPYAGVATPMTYEIDGEQYVVIAAGGSKVLQSESGDVLMAFKLSGGE